MQAFGTNTQATGHQEVRMTIDSGAGISVWPVDLCNDGRPTIPTAESLAGVGYAPAGAQSTLIRDEGKRHFALVDRNGQKTQITPRVAGVRKPLVSVADLNDRGFDVVFPATPRSTAAYAKHTSGDTTLTFDRRNQVFEYVVSVQPWSGNSRQA